MTETRPTETPRRTEAPRLSRALDGMPSAAPVRIIHMGVGNFHRAHQAWYTHRAPDADRWGIAGFTGRSAAMSDALTPQDGLYTLVTRAADGDSFEVVGSIVEVHPAADEDALLARFADPQVAVVTATVTEQGWLGGATPQRIAKGLAARRGAGAGPITILPCDNLPENGRVAHDTVLAAIDDPGLAAWVEQNVDFATSMVDRITPATTDELVSLVEDATGVRDVAPVPTETFSEWVVAGRFPAGRPAWEKAGVTMVEDVEPYEQRKLRLLNGAHSLLAYAGSVLGHTTVDQAVTDPRCRAWVEALWDENCRHLTLPADHLADYRAALVERWENPRVGHLLAQIAADGSAKIPVRVLPALRAERAAGRTPAGCAMAVAAWTCHLRGLGAPLKDADAGPFVDAARGDETSAAPGVLTLLDPDLGADDELVALVARSMAELTA
ncbi:mannitol dehydrogenase family protein [Mariniluteicoccus endophyticus]